MSLLIPKKCAGCALTTFQPIVCLACASAPPVLPKWYAVVHPGATFCTVHIGTEAVAVEHGRGGMTGNAACIDCVRIHRIPVRAGKGSFTGSLGAIYKRGLPKHTMYRHDDAAKAQRPKREVDTRAA